MTKKIILLVIMLVGAILVYGAKHLSGKINISQDEQKNEMIIKITGFIIVIVSAIIVFTGF